MPRQTEAGQGSDEGPLESEEQVRKEVDKAWPAGAFRSKRRAKTMTSEGRSAGMAP